MATTGFWPVKGRLKDVINYAQNPDKTTDKRFLDRVTATIQDNLKALTPLLNLLTLTQPVAQPQQAVTVSEKKDSAAEENMLEFLDSF